MPKTLFFAFPAFLQRFTVSAPIERRRSIKFLDFQAAHNGQFRRKIVEKLPFFADFSPKMTYVRPKCVPWRSNQEWRSIGADTVVILNLHMLYCSASASVGNKVYVSHKLQKDCPHNLLSAIEHSNRNMIYRKSSIRSRPPIQVYYIRSRKIQAKNWPQIKPK